MDFFLGIICGVLGYAIVSRYKEVQEKKNAPRRGRPPKATVKVTRKTPEQQKQEEENEL